MRGLRLALILLLIALRPALLLLLWPIVAIARLLSALGAISFVAGIYLIFHTADPKMISLGWLWIAFLPVFSLVAAALKALQRCLREDPTGRLGQQMFAHEPAGAQWSAHGRDTHRKMRSRSFSRLECSIVRRTVHPPPGARIPPRRLIRAGPIR
jgi:hypothetical protein